MTLADDLKMMLPELRAIAGDLGFRPYRVYSVRRTWTTGIPGDGTSTLVRTEITEDGQPPKVHVLTDKELALGGYTEKRIRIGPITPETTVGAVTAGTSLSLLHPDDLDVGEEFWIELVGPDAPAAGPTDRYAVVEVDTEKALRWMVTAERVGTTGTPTT